MACASCYLGASASGDPHYRTFDGIVHHFLNGDNRHYFLMRVTTNAGDDAFYLQGHLQYTPWRATTTKSLAFGVPGSYGYQVTMYRKGVLGPSDYDIMSDLVWYSVIISSTTTNQAEKYIREHVNNKLQELNQTLVVNSHQLVKLQKR